MSRQVFDFGAGPVPAHRHEHGGGWVADTARVDAGAYVGPSAQVSGEAQVKRSCHVVQCGPMGSRDAILTLYRTAGGGMGASTGCFSGSVDDLLARAGAKGTGAHYAALVPVLAAYLAERIAEVGEAEA